MHGKYFFKLTVLTQVEGTGQTTKLNWNSKAGMRSVGKLDMILGRREELGGVEIGNWYSSEYLMCDRFTLGDISEEEKTFLMIHSSNNQFILKIICINHKFK